MRPVLAAAVLLLVLPEAQAGPRSAAPADVAKQFYQMASQKHCAEAQDLFTAESLQAINQALGSPDGFLRFCAGRGGRAALAKLTVRSQEKKGDRAQVMLERSYDDGSTAVEKDELIRVSGVWKLSVGQSRGAVEGK